MIKGFDLLEIDEKSGDLRTRIPIDREALCGRRESPDCIFEAEIITKPQSLFKLFKVELEVEDLNDNAPVFPNSKIDINLSEETQLGSLIRLGKFTNSTRTQTENFTTHFRPNIPLLISCQSRFWSKWTNFGEGPNSS